VKTEDSQEERLGCSCKYSKNNLRKVSHRKGGTPKKGCKMPRSNYWWCRGTDDSGGKWEKLPKKGFCCCEESPMGRKLGPRKKSKKRIQDTPKKKEGFIKKILRQKGLFVELPRTRKKRIVPGGKKGLEQEPWRVYKFQFEIVARKKKGQL